MRYFLLVSLLAIGMLVPSLPVGSGVVFAACGDEVVDPGEACDDGAANGSGQTCCDTNCEFKPDGNASCDGNVCTRPDTCLAGVCTPGACADGTACTVCGGQCVDAGGACDCDFADPTPTPETCPEQGVPVDGACWYYGSVSASCDAVCGSVGLSYDDATRTFAGSDGTYENCIAVKDAVTAAGQGTCDPLTPGDQNCSGFGAASGIGCHCAPEFGFLVALARCAIPVTTSDAAIANRARYCACF